MPASITDKVTDTRNAARPNSARVSSGRSAGGATLACDSLAGWPTASKVHFVTYQIDSSSNPVAGTQLDCSGIVSGNNIGSLTVLDGTDTGNSVNDVVEMLPTASWGQDLADALTNQHSRTGAHVGINNTGGLTNTGGLSTDTLTVSSGTTLPAGDIATADLATSSVTSDKIATDSHILSYVETATGQSTGSATLVDATNVTLTFTTPASCTKILLRAEATVSSDTSGSTVLLAITNSANTVQVQRSLLTGVSNTNARQTIGLSRRITVTASTSYTFKLRFQTSGGTAVLNQGDTAESPQALWVERA